MECRVLANHDSVFGARSLENESKTKLLREAAEGKKMESGEPLVRLSSDDDWLLYKGHAV
jgi:hypothetical protein